MALETPNALHAGIVAFFITPGALPPPNDTADFVLTAAEGIKDLSFPPSPDFSGDFTDGLLLELLEPVNPAEGIFFCNQLQVVEGTDFGLTPLLLAPNTGNAEVDDFAAGNGNWMALAPTFNNTVGFLSVSIFELPQVDGAELPVNLPITS